MNGGKTGGEKWRVKDDGRVFDLLPTIFHQLSLCVQTYEREPWPTLGEYQRGQAQYCSAPNLLMKNLIELARDLRCRHRWFF